MNGKLGLHPNASLQIFRWNIDSVELFCIFFISLFISNCQWKRKSAEENYTSFLLKMDFICVLGFLRRNHCSVRNVMSTRINIHGHKIIPTMSSANIICFVCWLFEMFSAGSLKCIGRIFETIFAKKWIPIGHSMHW